MSSCCMNDEVQALFRIFVTKELGLNNLLYLRIAGKLLELNAETKFVKSCGMMILSEIIKS